MRSLGHVSEGNRRLADRVCDAVRASGEAAVFVRHSTGLAAAMAYTDRGYQSALQQHVADLVGVYRDEIDAETPLSRLVLDDLAVHVGQMHAARRIARCARG
jgi:hypothetical protein